MASQPLCWTADFTHTISFFRFLQPHIFWLLKQDGEGGKEEKSYFYFLLVVIEQLLTLIFKITFKLVNVESAWP